MGSVFPVLDLEERLQLGDKTRLNASKCFVAPLGTTDIATLTITPGLDGSAQDIFSATVEDRYLDWIFNTWNCDIIAGYNDKIDFDQSGVKSCTITPGTYTLAQLLTEIETQLNATGGISGTFTATSDFDDKITITNSTTSFELLPITGLNKDTQILKHIGFKLDKSGSSIVGNPVEYLHKKILVTANNGGTAQTLAKYVKLYSVYGDSLFSNDADLITWEPDIMSWVQSGRSSFLNIHREAQDQIIYWLDKEGYVDIYRNKYTKYAIIDVSEVNEWSTFKALEIIMWGISNKKDDVFLDKYFEYKKMGAEARNRAILRLDVDNDGVADTGEQVDIKFGEIVTR